MQPGVVVTQLLLLLTAAHGGSVGRARRSVGQFGDMIRQHVGREALLYNAYGNFCGTTSDYSRQPVDDVDSCCLRHDLCYRRLRSGACRDSWLGPYFTRYTWRRDQEGVVCGDSAGTCWRELCDCDRTAVECFAAHPYNPEHKRASIWDVLV